MKQALELIRKLIETHSATNESSDFDQGVREGLVMARRELMNNQAQQQADSANAECKRDHYLLGIAQHNFCPTCGVRLRR